ncbi:MAG TPA: crosslink repair DNA glycosylase YcaQ family protein, partial [Paracoccaceae bacterium]|nr:crosslink repair DNA glycosylase YcaQ family protein [Paracoccaceae bacterium]
MSVPVLSNLQARYVFLAKHGLASRPSGTGKGADLKAVIDDLGFVQLDSVNTFARAHDLILWSRRQQYRPPALGHLLARDRQVFEHWTHDASTIPITAFGHWRHRFTRDAVRLERMWTNDRRGDFTTTIDGVLRQISDHGCCTSGDVGANEVRGTGGWWDWHPSKTALEYLWRSGAVSVVRRQGFTKVYDLTERVIPTDHLAFRPTAAETLDWCCRGALARLNFATAAEIAAFWDILTLAEVRDWCAAGLACGQLIEIEVEGHDGQRRRAFARPDILDRTPPSPAARVRILSPFDPVMRDRKRALRLFGFDYRVEMFTPAPQRRYGYYVFPVLEGARVIGRIDMKADRAAGCLNVTAFWPEAGVRMGQGRLRGLNAALESAARFGGCA